MLATARIYNTETVYIGKCKQCRHGLRHNGFAVHERGDKDSTVAYKVGNHGVFGVCPEHGKFFPMRALVGRTVPEHKCDSRCTSATGPKCDCSCGGANHGADHGA